MLQWPWLLVRKQPELAAICSSPTALCTKEFEIQHGSDFVERALLYKPFPSSGSHQYKK